MLKDGELKWAETDLQLQTARGGQISVSTQHLPTEVPTIEENISRLCRSS